MNNSSLLKLEATICLMPDDARKAFDAYANALHDMNAPSKRLDERLRGNYGRLAVTALKIAMCIAAMDWADDGAQGIPKITLGHWVKAQNIAEEFRASLHRAIDQMNRSEDIRNEDKVLGYIILHQDNPPTERDIHHGAGVKNRKDVQAAIQALKDAGIIVQEPRKGKTGPGTWVYRVVE